MIPLMNEVLCGSRMQIGTETRVPIWLQLDIPFFKSLFPKRPIPLIEYNEVCNERVKNGVAASKPTPKHGTQVYK